MPHPANVTVLGVATTTLQQAPSAVAAVVPPPTSEPARAVSWLPPKAAVEAAPPMPARLAEGLAEADARRFGDDVVVAARGILEARGLQVWRRGDYVLVLRLGFAGEAPVDASPVRATVSVQREQTDPEELFKTDATSGWCVVPADCEFLRVWLPGEPGLLPVDVRRRELDKAKEGASGRREVVATLRPDTLLLRVLRCAAGSPLRYRLQLGGPSTVPPGGWAPASEIRLRLLGEDPNELVACTHALEGCQWRGRRKDLLGHERQCAQIRRIAASVQRAGGKQGKMNFSLSWKSDSGKTDMDLSVAHPCGHEVMYNMKRCPECSAQLDVDDRGELRRTSCENIFWSEDPPLGRYEVLVNLFSGLPVPFQLVARAGSTCHLFEHAGDVFDGGKKQMVCGFSWGPDGAVFDDCTVGIRHRHLRTVVRTIMAVRRLSVSGSSEHEDGEFDCCTDEEGWCHIHGGTEAMALAPPPGEDFRSYAPVEVYCRDVPLEVALPTRRTSHT